jgi:hypothetical protein
MCASFGKSSAMKYKQIEGKRRRKGGKDMRMRMRMRMRM